MIAVKPVLKWVFGPLAVLFLAIQFIPVDRSNPPVGTEMPAPPEVRAILQRSCYDCHSNQTVWPWYSRVAPVSWLVAYDVRKGREELNFSEWGHVSPEEEDYIRFEIVEEIEEGEMPLPVYLRMHPKARPTAEETAILRNWAESPPGGTIP